MKRAFTLLEALIVVAIVVLMAAFLWPVFSRSNRPGGRRAACQSNLKQIGLGLLQYAQDYGERLPHARVNVSTGWVDAIFPYVKSRQIFECPAAQSQNSETNFGSDYFYNRRLARATQKSIGVMSGTIMGGDGDDNAPTWSSWAQLPAGASTNSSSPCQRHQGAGNYLFADGHVKALQPMSILLNFDRSSSSAKFDFR